MKIYRATLAIVSAIFWVGTMISLKGADSWWTNALLFVTSVGCGYVTAANLRQLRNLALEETEDETLGG